MRELGARFIAPAASAVLVLSGVACNALLDIPEYRAQPDESSGGSSVTGGSSGSVTGGSSGTSGAGAGAGAGLGGKGGSGGAPSTGGSSGSGGESGSGSTSSPCEFEPGDFTFDTVSTEGFEVTYTYPETLLNTSSLASEDGFLKIRVGFDGEQQEYVTAAEFQPAADLRGKLVTACVRMSSNVDDSPDLPSIELLATSGDDQDNAYSSAKHFVDGEWIVLELLTDLPSREDGPYDASDTRYIGFALWTDFGDYGSIVVDVDGISIRTAP